MNQLKDQNNLRKKMENSTYPSIMGRAGAFLLDGLIFLPFLFIILFIQGRINKNANLIYLCFIIQLFSSFFSSFYRVFFTKKFNGTPGKLICKFKIIRADGMTVSWITAIKRELITIIVSFIYFILFYYTYFTNLEIINNFSDLSVIYANSVLSKIYSLFMFIVYIIDYGRARSSSKRQTFHDKIANTVVVYKYVNQ